jgi:glucose/arabinose dehydrogenase
VVRRNGDVYVAVNPAPDGTDPGRLLALRDEDGDGRLERVETIADTGGTGLDLSAGGLHLYFGQADRVLRYRLTGRELVPFGEPSVVVSGLPADGDHRAKAVKLDGHGGLFVNIASASNACQVENRVPFSPGVLPCPELEIRAGVWRFSALASNQVQADGRRHATGLRNTTALDIQPGSRRLWGVQNGRDQLFENWPNLFTAEDDRRAPAEEFVRLDRGLDNGWPYCYEDARKDRRARKVLAPEYGGDGTIRGRCARLRGAALDLPAHWAPLGLHFYRGRQFPGEFRNDAFIATHGARFPGPPEGPGFNVLHVSFREGRPVSWRVFADGFAGGNPTPLAAENRPVGLAEGPDGSLYVTSDQLPGRIWRILYRGDRD